MKIISFSTTEKMFEGNRYTEYVFKLNDNGQRRLVKCTGRTSCMCLTESGELISEGRLDTMSPSAGDSIEFFLDLKDRICGIELIIEEGGINNVQS